jgi:predicted DNA-binding protein YlxM (UPF0122 family)
VGIGANNMTPRNMSHNANCVGYLPIVSALNPGTGGFPDTHYLISRQERGYKPSFIAILHFPIIKNNHSSAQSLALIKKMIKLSISEIAILFNVSRQTIYNWLSGEEPSIENVIKIENLLKTLNFLTDAGLTSSTFLKRKIIGAQSLFDIIQNGTPSLEAAQKLVSIIQNEIKQRATLEERLKERKPNPKNYDDYGSPMLD